MGVFHPYNVACPSCDGRYVVTLANTVNVTRFPALKQRILDRTFNQGVCGVCGYVAAVEKPFLYLDMEASLHISVYPRKERHFHKRAARETDILFDAFNDVKIGQMRTRRVVFGLEELREKIVAADAGLSDETVETLKLYVIKEHPFLIQKKRMRISLDHVHPEKLGFLCTFDLDPESFMVSAPRAFFDALGDQMEGKSDAVSRGSPLQRAKAEHGQNLVRNTFAAAPRKAAWVNLWRLNPSNQALQTLSSFAEQIRKGEDIDLSGAEFRRMLTTLPRGNQLPSWAKRDLQTIETYANAQNRGDVEDALFEVRFGKIDGLDDDWFKNEDKNDISAIWTLLKNLPDIAIEGNTWIQNITLDTSEAGGGVYYYERKEISIGSGIQSETYTFRNVILHEVGHGVQQMYDQRRPPLVTPWLEQAFGWRRFGLSAAGIDAWIELMGGYPAGTSAATKTTVRSFIQQSTGVNGFKAPAIVKGPTGHLWNNQNWGPRAAFEKTKNDWWSSCSGWHAANGKRFFVNHYYQELMCLNDAAVQLIISSMPDRYAAMSPFEFFAELFAWYYDGASPKRDRIPAGVASWFVKNVGALDTGAPFRPRTPAARRTRKSVRKATAKRAKSKAKKRVSRRKRPG